MVPLDLNMPRYGSKTHHNHHKKITEICARCTIWWKTGRNSWGNKASLRQVCEELDQRQIPVPRRWRTGRTESLRKVGLHGWTPSTSDTNRNVVQASDVGRTMNAGLASESKAARIRRILAALSPGEREALHRFYALEQDTEEISRAIGLSENALRELKSRVRKAYQQTQ